MAEAGGEGEIRNPKTEGRRKSEGRNPNGAGQSTDRSWARQVLECASPLALGRRPMAFSGLESARGLAHSKTLARDGRGRTCLLPQAFPFSLATNAA